MNILDSAKSSAKKAQFEADRFMRIQRIQKDANSLRRKVQQTKLQLGSTTYDLFKNDQITDPELAEICGSIVQLETDISSKEAEIALIKEEISTEGIEYSEREVTASPAVDVVGEVSTGYKIATPAAALVVLFFFMPWVMASCGGQALGSFSGWQLASGINYQTGFGSQPIPGEPALFLVLLAVIGVLVLAYLYWRRKQLKLWDSLGVIVLGLIPLAVFLIYSGAKQEAAREGILLEYRIGIWGTIIGCLAVIVGGAFNWRDGSKAEKQVEEYLET